MKTGKKIAVSLLGIICTASLAGGLSACKAKKSPVGMPEHLTTVRMALPNDGSLPTAHSGIENIGYMATVLDNQPYYHAYARNSAKVMGYEQITQTWKDYKGKELSGYDGGVMICSDLSYSTFVKSGTQACFVNDKAYMRSSSKPGKSTTSTTANWNNGTPEYFDKETYLTRYGEFSTELSVYVINEDTVNDWSDVTVEENGTYTQTFYLKNEAACYYQYKLKTNGNLKGYPDFDYINITFNFDKDWNVLSSYCEEKAKVAPKALGGAANKGTFKTNTSFYYGEGDFDNAHYAYFDDFFKNYVGKDISSGGNDSSAEKPELLDVLAGGFGKVIGEEGQQFSAKLKIGGTDYDGKVYARLSDMSDILNSLDVRIALEKAGSGKQDLYLEFNKGAVNVYYSDTFAMTANLDAVKTVINQFSEWVKQFAKPADASAASYTAAEEEEGGLDLASLLASLKLTYTDSSAKISLESDDLLGTGIGAKLSLDFDRTIEEDGSNSYSFKNASLDSITYDANSIALSLALATDSSAVISRNPVSTSADLADYAEGVYNMLNADTLKVNIGLDGKNNKVISYLDGVKISAEAYVALGSEIATKVNIFAEYAGLSVKLSAYYDVNIHGGNYGKVYLNLTEFNGTALDAKVYSNLNDTVTAVKQLLSAVNGATPATLSETGTDEQVNKLAGIVNGVLNLNFGKVIGDLYASNSEIRVAVNVDEIIGALGLDLKGLQFGTAALKLNLGDKKNTSLSLGLSGLGLDMNVEGSSTEITEPNVEEYLDATALVNLVTKAADAAKKIIEAQDIAFNIDATAVIDDIPVAVKGAGEVVWKNGKMRVALDLNLSIANGTSSAAKDSVALKLVYDQSVTEEDKPFVKFSVGSVAMQICKKDLTEVKDGINLIKKNIDLLLNGEKTGNATPAQAVATYGAAAQSSNVTDDIKNVLTNENVQQVLSAILGFASDLNVELTGKDLNTLVIKHLTNGSLTLGTDNNLSLVLNAKNNDGTPILDLSANVEAGSGKKISAVSAAIDELEVFSTEKAGEAFATVVYNYLFAMFDNLSVKNVLGSDTFAVKVSLDGNKSAIPQLSGITVNAELYYTEALEGTTISENRLVEADINLDIKGTKVKANARYNAQNLYISLDEMNGTVISGVKFTASRYDIYTAAEQLINIITDENIIKSLSKLINPAASSSPAAYAAVLADEGEKNALTDVVSKLLSFDFAKAFNFGKVDGVNIATVEVDYLLEALGVSAPKLGTATVGINPKTHKIDAKLTLDGNAWAALSAEATKEHVYSPDWKDGYIDIAFINNLLEDIVKTTVKNGEFQTLYTLTGNVNINITIIGNVPINDVKLSAGLDENGKFYFSLTGNLTDTKVPLLNYTVTKKMPISVTYSNGYITMGRTNESGAPIYKVMTAEYLMANLLDSNNSPVRWLLGTSDKAWGLISDNVHLDIDTGLTKPETYYLYKQNETVKPDEPSEQKSFNLADLLSGLSVKIDGNEIGAYGDCSSAVSNLGLTDNYYAVDANLESLLGSTFKHLYFAILRDGNGLTGITAYTEIAGAVKVKIDLGNLTTDKSAAAPDYLPIVLKDHAIDFNKYDNAEMDAEHKKPTFGCYSTETDTYDTLDMLGSVKLTVVGGGLAESREVTLRSTSTVYLRDASSTVWANDEHTLIVIYVDKDGKDLGTSMIITSDTTIYAATTEAYEVTFNLGEYGESYNRIMAPNDKFAAAVLDGGTVTFAGWYADADLKTPVVCANDLVAVNGVRTAYAKFIEAEYTEKNGVKYKAYVNDDGETCMAVSGFDAAAVTDGTDYTASGATLTIADNINGYAVTRINSNAFANANLKNVVVPETVTWVGSRAFLDNYGIESVVFLADSVYMQGKDKNTVFYGCSETNGGKSTKIKVYYNEITAEAGSDWTYFRDGGLYIGRSGGGELIGGGNWSYTVFAVESGVGVDLTDSNFGFNTDGIKITAMSADQMSAEVSRILNGKSAENGVINEYVVTVSGGYENNGKLNKVVINVVHNETPYYLVTVDAAGTIIQGTTETFANKVYAKAGTEVTLLPPEGKVFKEISASGVTVTDGKFTMPEASVSVNVVCDDAPINKTTINSSVAYTYAGNNYGANEQLVIEDIEQNVTVLDTIEASGYIFLGWAYNNGTSLEFTDSVVKYGNYYAIWAEAREEITSVTVLTGGTDANAAAVTVDTAKANSFYKWYTDNAFTMEATTITLENTVLYGRLNYTLTVNAVKSGAYEIKVDGKKQGSYSVGVLEGEAVYASDVENNSKVYNIKTASGDTIVGEIRIKTGNIFSNKTAVLSVTCSDGSWTDVTSKVTVTQNLTFAFTC